MSQFILYALIACFYLNVYSQNNANSNFLLAQQLENSGNIKEAVALYEDLYKNNPSNYIYTESLQRVYAKIKQYNKAVLIINKWLSSNPNDVNAMAKLSNIFIYQNKIKSADSILKTMQHLHKNNQNIYRMVANIWMEHRQYDSCITTYLNGRTNLKDSTIFNQELSYLYSILHKYINATNEYILTLVKTPSLWQQIKNYINPWLKEKDYTNNSINLFENSLTKYPKIIELRKLLAWLYFENKDYEAAKKHYTVIDSSTNSDGYELFSFAQNLFKLQEFDKSAETFNYISNYSKNNYLTSEAKLNCVVSIDELYKIKYKDSVSIHNNFKDVISKYELLLNNNNQNVRSKAAYRIALIKLELFNDYYGALNIFQNLKQSKPPTDILYLSSIKCAEILTILNKIDDAINEYKWISGINTEYDNYVSTYKLAELYYLTAEYDSALSILQNFNIKSNEDIANDALNLQYFIQENKSSNIDALKEFSKSKLLILQNKYLDALLILQKIVSNYNNTPLIDNAYMEIANIYVLLKNYNYAINTYKQITLSTNEGIYKDQAQFKIAELYEEYLNNKSQAITEYSKILEQYPNSLYTEKARNKIRLLRGDKQ